MYNTEIKNKSYDSAGEFVNFIKTINIVIDVDGNNNIMYTLDEEKIHLIYSLFRAIRSNNHIEFMNTRRQIGSTTLYSLYLIYKSLRSRYDKHQPMILAMNVCQAKEIVYTIKRIIDLSGLSIIIPLQYVKNSGKLVFIDGDNVRYKTLLIDYSNFDPIIRPNDLPEETRGILDPTCKIINNMVFDYVKFN